MQMVIAVALLVGVLGFAVAAPARLPEVLVAGPAAALAVLLGLVSPGAAWAEIVALAPTVGFLAAVLVLAHLADTAGVFRYAGALAARLGGGTPHRLLGVVFVIAALVTAVLSLDATVVLLTPVVFATTAAVGVRARPHVYACTHLANSASLLLPVSNLTNLLAFAATGLTFAGFAGLMALPWLAVIGTEYLVFRRFFAADLGTPAQPVPVPAPPAPRYALAVLALTLAGFAVAEPLGVHPAWTAAGGAALLALPELRRTPRRLGRILAETNPAFCGFVLALGVVVLAVRRHGLGALLDGLVPGRGDLLGLLAVAALAAVLANLVNNLPATLVLVPAVAHSPGLVLAVLIGVNVGPNLTYVGSLATLLWRRILHAHDARPTVAEFLRLGALTVPACLASGVVALWLGLRLWGV
ncbi:ArsB/NhaD family transporter [Longispora urticae]